MADALTQEQYQKGQSNLASLHRELHAEQISAFKEAFGGMSSELRSMTTAITESRIAATGEKVSGGGMGVGIMLALALSVVGLLGGQAAIMFGLMAPMFIMVQETKRDVDGQNQWMRVDDNRERNDAAKLAALRAEVTEISKSHSRDQTAEMLERLIEKLWSRFEKVELKVQAAN